jgi:hypothetical protein
VAAVSLRENIIIRPDTHDFSMVIPAKFILIGHQSLAVQN